jgi:hypothetical protein
MKTYGGVAPPFLTSALDGGEWSASRPSRFTSGERALGTRWLGGWVGPRAGLVSVEKRKTSCLCWERNPRCPSRRCSVIGFSIQIILYSGKWCLPLASTSRCRELEGCSEPFYHPVECRLARHRGSCLPMIHCSWASNMMENCHLGRCCN